MIIEDLRGVLPTRTDHDFTGSALVVWDGEHWQYRERNKPIDTIAIHHSEGYATW